MKSLKQLQIIKTIPAFALLLIMGASVHAETSATKTLPAPIQNYLDKSHTGWKLVEGDPICHSQAVVKGDFDGNKQTDYALMFQDKRDGYIVAFLANGTNFKPVVVNKGYVGDGGFLVLARKGEPYAPQPLKTDALVSGGAVNHLPFTTFIVLASLARSLLLTDQASLKTTLKPTTMKRIPV